LARESGVKVQLVVTGMCQSAGTLLLTSVPVEQRYATRHTRFMIHTCNVSGDGTSVQLKPIAPDKPAPWWRRLFMKRKRAELLKSSLVAEGYDLQRAMTDLYLTETNLTQEQLIELYRDDSYFGADKALDIGLVGHIL
jgi:ATP-dependent protease ClpP protease subunit